MKPMFSYFGSKYKAAKHYGAPRRDIVIEPFAGSAAYSLFWEPRKAILIDKSPTICAIWDFLIKASITDIQALPVDFEHVDDLNIGDAEKALIGFWIGKGKVTPGKSRSLWGRQYAKHNDCKVWGEPVKNRLSQQIEKIRDWKIINGDYKDAPEIDAHWFIDPPYQERGKRYPYNDVDYTHLAEWSQKRIGFVQVCENKGADWLNFKDFRSVNTYHHITSDGVRKARYTHEVLFEQ